MALITLGANSGKGKVLQVEQAVNSTYVTTSSNTYSDTGLSDTITPSSTSNKVLITISAALGNTDAAARNNQVRILRGTTEIEEFSRASFCSDGHTNNHETFIFLDSPSTTSATTYKLQYKTDGGVLRLNDFSNASPSSSITLMEIQG